MEEILASIRKIISEDSSEPAQAAAPAQAAPASAPAEPDVLELTQEVHEEPPAPPPPPPTPAPVAAAPTPPPAVAKPADDVVFETIEETSVSSQGQTPAHSSEGIFSDKTRRALTDAFSSIEPEPAQETPRPIPSVSGLSVEAVFERAVREAFDPMLQKWLTDNADMIVEHMKPVISAWLDEHFPAMLQEAVRNEVANAAKPRR